MKSNNFHSVIFVLFSNVNWILIGINKLLNVRYSIEILFPINYDVRNSNLGWFLL